MDHDSFVCVPIFGAWTVEQLDENVGAVAVDLSDEQFVRIEAAGHEE